MTASVVGHKGDIQISGDNILACPCVNENPQRSICRIVLEFELGCDKLSFIANIFPEYGHFPSYMTENFKSHHHIWLSMGDDRATGREIVERLGGRDLNKDGTVIDLAIVGSSRFYDFSVIEEQIESWVEENGYPDLIIIGGASGVDYLAERWADNNNIPIAIFHEQWVGERGGLVDSGRAEAPNTLTKAIIESATHVLAFPSQTSKWTQITCELAKEMGRPVTISPIEDEITA